MSEYEFYVAVTAGFLLWLRHCYLEAVHLTRPRRSDHPHADAHWDIPGRPSHE